MDRSQDHIQEMLKTFIQVYEAKQLQGEVYQFRAMNTPTGFRIDVHLTPSLSSHIEVHVSKV